MQISPVLPESPEESSERLTPQQQLSGMRAAYIGQAAGLPLVHVLFASAIGTLLIKRLGGSDLQSLLLGSLLTGLYFLQLPTSILVPARWGKSFMLWAWMACGVLIAGVAIVPSLMETGPATVWVILVLAAGAAGLTVSGTTFWFPLLHDVVPAHQRGRFFGRMRAIWTACVLGLTLAAGAALGTDPEIWRFQLVLAALLPLYLLRNVFLARIATVPVSLSGQDDHREWKSHLRSLLGRHDVLIFVGYCAGVLFLATFLALPLVLYMRRMGFAPRDNVIVFSFTQAGMMLAYLLAGTLTDRVGTRRVLGMTNLGLSLVCFWIVAIGRTDPSVAKVLMPLAMLGSGSMVAMMGVASSAQLFHMAPQRGRAFFMCFCTVVTGTATAASPLLIGVILDAVPAEWSLSIGALELDIFQVLIGAAGIALLGMLGLVRFVRDFRPHDDLA